MSETTAAGNAKRQGVLDRWQSQYDLGASEVKATRPLSKRRAEVTVLDAVGHGIDLGKDVYAAFTASATLYTEGAPTAHAIRAAAEKAVAHAKKFDAGQARDAAIEQFKEHPATWVMPEPTLPAAEVALGAAIIIESAVEAALAELYAMGLATLKAPRIEGVLAKAWCEIVHPVLDDDMTRGEAAALEGQADDAAAVIEQLYVLHLGGLNRQDQKLLRSLFADRPADMPTLALVHETTRRHEFEAQKRTEQAREAREAKSERMRAESAANAQARNPARAEALEDA